MTAPVASTGRRPRRPQYLPLQILLVFLVVYFLIPFWWVIVNSSKSSAGLFGGGNALWFADDINYLENLKDLFTYGGGIYAKWLLNSALYAFVGGIGATVLAVLAGYGFAKYRFAGRRLAFAILLGAVMVPTTALVIPTFILFSQVGLTNTIWAVIFPTWLNPFGVYLMNVYAREAVPDELLDAARVDGAGELRVMISVVARLAKPAIAAVALFMFLLTFSDFFGPLLYAGDEESNWTLSVGLAQFRTLHQVQWNLTMAATLLVMAPVVVLFFTAQNAFVEGVTLTGVKE